MGANSKSRIIQTLLAILFISFFLMPFLFLIIQSSDFIWPDNEELLWAIKNSLIQSVLSASLTVLFGFIVSFGLQRYSNKYFESLFLFPSFVPALFVILFFLEVFEPFPRNNFAVAILQMYIYTGLVAVSFKRSQQIIWPGLIRQAMVMGMTRWRFVFHTLSAFKSEFISNWSYVFITALTSFNIPLIIGGNHGTNLEVLIYEKLRIEGDWRQSISISFVQVIIVFLSTVFFVKGKKISLENTKIFKNNILSQTEKKWIGSGFVFGISLIVYFLFVVFLGMAILKIFFISPQVWNLVQPAQDFFGKSLFLCLISSGLTAVGLLFYVALWPNSILKKFFKSYLPPSSVLLGISAFFWPFGTEGWGLEWKYVLVTVLLGFPFLTKLSWESELEKLYRQLEVSETMGVSKWSWLVNISWPQVLPKICDLAFLQSVWIAGDFALYKMVVNQDKTVASYMSTLMSSYRIDAAMVCGSFVVVMILFNFTFWIGIKKLCQK